jgi:glycosyltransferase involved in cell wall biosynthesis
MTPPIPVSVIVITLNEERNIGTCLTSVRACEQIVVVDSGSTDGTVALARRHGAEVVEHPFDGYSAQKNWAIESIHLRNEWLLFMDADERVTPDLEASMRQVTSEVNAADAYFVNREFRFLGHTFRHSGLSPNWHLRLVKRRVARFEERAVDERLVPPATTGRLAGRLLHDDQRGVAAWVSRHNIYSDLNATIRVRRGEDSDLVVTARRALHDPTLRRRWVKRSVWPHIPAKPAVVFAYMYVLRRGFLDGRAGWSYAWMLAGYEFLTGLKMREWREAKRSSFDGASRSAQFGNANPGASSPQSATDSNADNGLTRAPMAPTIKPSSPRPRSSPGIE